MTDRPILFSALMVRAILEGRKSMTRRVLKPQPNERARGCYARPDGSWVWLDAHRENNGTGYTGTRLDNRHFFTPYAPGDRLWVRESCHAVEYEDGTDAVEYLADGACTRIANTTQSADQWGALYHYGKKGPDRAHREGQKVPSIHMPRWASRLTLTVTDVRVQRLQEISYNDTRAEGIEATEIWQRRQSACLEHNEECGSVCRDSFRDLWNSLHGPDAWDANPWVTAISFDVHRCNIDQMPGGENDE